MYGLFFCGFLASATAFKTSMLTSAIDAVGPVICLTKDLSDQALRQKCPLS